MQLRDLALKLFRGNVKKYRMFIICNSLAIGMLLSLRLLLENAYLNDARLVDPMISSNVFAPTFFMYVFVAFIVPYTCLLMNKQIQKNYGILLSMGLTWKKLITCIIMENGMSIILSLVGGLFSGNILEIILLFIMKWIIGIDALVFDQSITAYIQIFLYLTILYAITLAVVTISLYRKNILKIITEERQVEAKKGNRAAYGAGVLLFSFALLAAFVFCKESEGTSLLLAIPVSFVGILVMVLNSSFLFQKNRNRNLFLLADYLHSFRRNAKACLMCVALYGMLVFVITVSMVTAGDLKRNVEQYNPYDMVFSYENNKDDQVLDGMIENKSQTIRYESQVPFFYTRSYAVLGAGDVLKETGHSYDIPEGKFVLIRSNISDDGYAHEPGTVLQKVEMEGQQFKLFKDTDDLLFCRGGGLTDQLILLNQNDFDRILDKAPDMEQVLKLIRFDNIRGTGLLADKIASYTGRDVASYERDLLRAQKSGAVLCLLMSYISIVFLICVFLTCSYKLQSERETDQRNIRIVSSIGADHTVILKYIRNKLGAAVIWPFYIAWIWVAFLTGIYGYYSAGFVMTLVQTFFIGVMIWLLIKMILRLVFRLKYN